jgi:probable F420-dependent oxidoreductase
VRVGAIIPNAGPLPERLGLARMAAVAEAAGAESLWVSDHLLMVDADTRDYPFSGDGRPTWPADSPYLEALTCCSFIAAATSRCRIGTAVLVLPQRNVLEFAKTAATLDVLSGGRLVLGIGAGWYRDEYEALGYGFDSRGRRLDEMLDVLRACWTGRPPAFAGSEIQVPPGVVLQPVPSQPGGPPLLVGGMSPAALRRAALRADGWVGIAWVDRLDAGSLARRLDTFRRLRADAGADPSQAVLKLHARPDDASAIPAAIAALEPLGFDELIVEPPWALGHDAAAQTIQAARSAVETPPAAGDRR